jgi:hypothetical protein
MTRQASWEKKKEISSQLTFNLYDFHYADQDLPLLAAPQTLNLHDLSVVAPLFTVTESQAKDASAIQRHLRTF